MNAADAIQRIERAAVVRRLSFIAGAILIAAIALGVYFRSSPSHALPAALDTAIVHHQIASAVDTAEIHRLERVAATARDAQRRDSTRAAVLERSATADRRRADSIVAALAAATSTSDSLARLQAAYEARSAEAVALRDENAAKDGEIASATQRGDSLSAALGRSKSMAARADSVIAAAVKVVRASDPPCHVARFFSCPSRTTTAIGAVIATVVVIKLAPPALQSLRGK